jgi:hypothetical protein
VLLARGPGDVDDADVRSKDQVVEALLDGAEVLVGDVTDDVLGLGLEPGELLAVAGHAHTLLVDVVLDVSRTGLGRHVKALQEHLHTLVDRVHLT